MTGGQGASVMEHFQDLEDHRVERSKRHQLLDIVAIAICAVSTTTGRASRPFTWSSPECRPTP